MNSTTINWKKQEPSKIQFSSSSQCYQQYPTRLKKPHVVKSSEKKVLFNVPTPTAKQERIQNDDSSSNAHPYFMSGNALTPKFRSPSFRNAPFCSSRAAAITSMIVVLIIILAAVIMGVVFSTTSSQTKGSGTTAGAGAGSNNLNQLSTTQPVNALSTVIIGSQSGAPCSSYTTIDDPSRSVTQVGLYGTCDNGPIFNTSTGGAWIRFVGTGRTIMAMSPPAVNLCGGFLTGWFSGALPTIPGSTSDGFACVGSSGNPCLVNNTVSVTYCSGTFYIYFLPPVTMCDARYCTT